MSQCRMEGKPNAWCQPGGAQKSDVPALKVQLEPESPRGSKERLSMAPGPLPREESGLLRKGKTGDKALDKTNKD